MHQQHDANYWIQRLSDEIDETRWRAVDALRHILSPETSIPLFVSLLQTDPYWRVRALACHAIYDITHEEERHCVIPFIPHIAAAIRDPDNHVCLNAIYTLEMLADDAADTLPLLREALTNAYDEIGTALCSAIEVIENRRPRPARPGNDTATWTPPGR